MLTVLVRKDRGHDTSLSLSISFHMNLKLLLGRVWGVERGRERERAYPILLVI